MWIDDFVKCFDVDDNQKLDIEKAFLLKNANIPNNIYKYRGVNDFSLKNLADDTVWLTSPSKYNDPFDCAATLSTIEMHNTIIRHNLHQPPNQAELDKYITEDEYAEIRKSDRPMRLLAQRALEKDPNVDISKMETMLDALEQAAISVSASFTKEVTDHIREGIKMCSFSTNASSVIMWSHYADYHKGFCIEYDISHLNAADMRRRMMFPAIYKESLFDCTKFFAASMRDPTKFNNLFPVLQALHKSPEWAYEKEWRLFFNAGVIDHEQDYSMPTPSKVLIGAKISDADRDRVTSICNKKNIPVVQMHLKADSFEMEVK